MPTQTWLSQNAVQGRFRSRPGAITSRVDNPDAPQECIAGRRGMQPVLVIVTVAFSLVGLLMMALG